MTGVMFMILGLVAIIEPFAAGLSVTLLVGWLLIAAGMTHVISIMRRDEGGAIWHIAVALAYVAGGTYFVMHPLIALAGLTLLLTIVLFVEAGVDTVAYAAQRDEPNAGWLLANAAVTAALGVLIAVHWPSTAAWAIGTIFGINLLTTGVSRVMLGVAARRLVSD